MYPDFLSLYMKNYIIKLYGSFKSKKTRFNLAIAPRFAVFNAKLRFLGLKHSNAFCRHVFRIFDPRSGPSGRHEVSFHGHVGGARGSFSCPNVTHMDIVGGPGVSP